MLQMRWYNAKYAARASAKRMLSRGATLPSETIVSKIPKSNFKMYAAYQFFIESFLTPSEEDLFRASHVPPIPRGLVKKGSCDHV